MKPLLPIYKLFFDKKFLERIDKESKNHFMTKSTHFAYYTKQGESFVLTSYNNTKQIILLQQPVILKPYRISDSNILQQPIPQYFNSPGYSFNEILDHHKIKAFYNINPNNIIEKIEGILVIDKNTTKIESAYNFKRIKNE